MPMRDYVQILRQQRSGSTLFQPSAPALNPAEIPALLKQATNKLAFNEAQEECSRKFVDSVLRQIPGKALANQPRELIELTQSGLKTVPGYHPPKPGMRKDLK